MLRYHCDACFRNVVQLEPCLTSTKLKITFKYIWECSFSVGSDTLLEEYVAIKRKLIHATFSCLTTRRTIYAWIIAKLCSSCHFKIRGRNSRSSRRKKATNYLKRNACMNFILPAELLHVVVSNAILLWRRRSINTVDENDIRRITISQCRATSNLNDSGNYWRPVGIFVLTRQRGYSSSFRLIDSTICRGGSCREGPEFSVSIRALRAWYFQGRWHQCVERVGSEFWAR